MEFTETQSRRSSSTRGRWPAGASGQVLEAVGGARTRNELADAGWLERRTVDETARRLVVDAAGRSGARHERATPRRPRGHELMLQSRPSKHGHRPPLAGVPEGRITLAELGRPVQKRRSGHARAVPGCHHRPAARGVYPSRQGVSPAERCS